MATSTPEQLEASFTATEAGGSRLPGAVRRRLMPDASIDVFTEVRFPSREWALLIRSTEDTEDRDLILASGLVCRIRGGSVEIVAGPETDRFLFCTLLADLVRQLHIHTANPTLALVRRLNAWRKMLDRGLSTGLTPEARMGLFGELLTLREILLPAIGTAAIPAWEGPAGAPRDFSHFSAAVEVKTVGRRSANQCQISSESQLETAASTDLFLIHQVVTHAPSGVSLVDMVEELRSDPRVQPELSRFENSLLEAGWLDSHSMQYVNDRYALSRRQCFQVVDGFPRLTSSALPSGVSRVSYNIDLSVCDAYKVNEGTVRSSISLAGKGKE
ncbi:PD-(D/E)XK motif protein [Streptomyces sp. NPDC059837]|uniref:PD-(D/E)XK motif protein n=1 Tax=Streptomyces sp. NPDC059837 TaxID=3346968 RepID=UPI003663CA69